MAGPNDEVHREIANRFGFHPNVSALDGAQHDQLRRLFADCAHEAVELTPEGRERALMVTSLDQALMWANAAVARARPLATD